MSESLNVLRTGRYEARVKAELATVSAEADRQRKTWNLRNEALRSLRETTYGVKVSRPGEFHPKPPSEPYVRLSTHTAPVIQSMNIFGISYGFFPLMDSSLPVDPYSEQDNTTPSLPLH